MGLFDKKSERKVGSNFDKSDADKIFDALDKHAFDEPKKVNKNLKKEMDLTKEVSDLLKLTENCGDNEAIDLFKKVLAIDPANAQAYEGLSQIYQKKGDTDSEIAILKSAVKNLQTSKVKSTLIARLKEINR
ncbi:MAG: tetratricopeptide repeat protein [Methanobrevibacter sp.]|nr:tetratricopeptide repeat protein [Methanobrevibacter sp.]